MQRVTIDDVDNEVDSTDVKRSLTDALGMENASLNYYELAPGQSFAYGYHKHGTQEEVFLVLSGTVTFETDEGDVTVAEGDAIRFAPGEFQQGINRTDERVTAFALGAPQNLGESELYRYCEECGERTQNTIEWGEERGVKVTRCLNCESVTGRFGRNGPIE